MKKLNIDRRDFLKTSGMLASSLALLSGCKNKDGKVMDTETSEFVLNGKMTYRSFPALDNDKVSLLGYGCMRFPKIPNPNGKGEIIDQETVDRLVDYAIENGVNFFDTAPAYSGGQSEIAIGKSLKRYPREKFYISTKLSNFSNWTHDNSVLMYKKSFEALQVDYIDYYVLHSIGSRGDITEFHKRYIDNGMVDYLVKEREAGRIRHLGWSFHGTQQTFDDMLELHEKYHWDFVIIQMNYVDWKIAQGSGIGAEYLYSELEKRNIPVIIMEPLLGGRLSKLPQHVIARLKEQAPENSAASWAFRFCGSYKNVLTVMSGMTYMEHLQDNLKTFSPLKPLSDEEMNFLLETAGIINSYPTIPCNDCQYCMPCPYGIDIPSILLHYNKCVNEGNVPESTQDPNYRKARQAFLVGYNRNVEKIRQADHCIGCNQCSHHCPQRINIPRELQRIDKFVEKLKTDKL